MKLRFAFILSAILVVVAGLLFWHFTGERRNANRIIDAIEEYRNLHGRLPRADDHEVMTDLGFELRAEWYPDWYPDYEVRENGMYRITIFEFGENDWIYDSSYRKRMEGYPPLRRPK